MDNTFQSQYGEGQTSKMPKGRSKMVATMHKGKEGELLQVSNNDYLLLTAVVEAVGMIALIAMNYCLRFDPGSRDGASLADYPKVVLGASDMLPARPYYNYSLSHHDNQNPAVSGAGTFGITFGMPEYSFFVPVFVLPLLAILLTELCKSFYPSKQLKNVVFVGMTFFQVYRRILRFSFVFLLFGSMAGMSTAFIKLLVPVPRPHFLYVCTKPHSKDNMSDILDTKAHLKDMMPEEDVGYTSVAELCTNQATSEVWEALRSFPSYHATIAVYCTAFMLLYLYYTMRFRGLYSVSIWLSLPIFVMGAIGTLHRWVTFHATLGDIAWGGVIGLLMALYAVYGMLDRFRERVWVLTPSTTAAAAAPLPSARNPDQQPDTDYRRLGAPQSQQLPRLAPTDPARPRHLDAHPRKEQSRVQSRPPTQAYNDSFVMEEDYPPPRRVEQRDYPPPRRALQGENYSRQRHSMPPPPRAPSAPRPASAYPLLRPPAEGTSYF